MKKLLFCASMMLVTVGAQAQLKVYENGKIAIQTTETPKAALSLGYAADTIYSAAITGVNHGLHARRVGTATKTTDSWTSGVSGSNVPNGS